MDPEHKHPQAKHQKLCSENPSMPQQDSIIPSASLFHPLSLPIPLPPTIPPRPISPQFSVPNLHLPLDIVINDDIHSGRRSVSQNVSILLSVMKSLNTYHRIAIYNLQARYPNSTPGVINQVVNLISRSIGLQRFWTIFERLEQLRLVGVEGLLDEMNLLPRGEEIWEDFQVTDKPGALKAHQIVLDVAKVLGEYFDWSWTDLAPICYLETGCYINLHPYRMWLQ
ncbi:hypothetical protein BDZ45DRAFT_693743 [Acephala macrosclerotiorum]|nr:hypothetical protein BDZ45DRAFT_693743 [Acephala macrosclerotiorum]